ncbi:MAG: hypothetical protein H0X39_00075 [Actinobacteria bacterium]|nr:hypothetical protein [Actinomycetota bacterium]
MQAAILKSIELGNYNHHAAAAAGISERMFYDWIESDAQFAADVARARDVATESLVNVVRGAAMNDWRAGAWLLERTRAGQFRESKEVEHGGSIAIDSLLLGEPDEAA